MSVKLSISSHVKISYFYMCSDTTFLGGRNPCKTLQFINIYIYFLNLNRINFGQRSTLGGAVTIIINGSKISIHRFIATTLFRVVKEWPHSSGNIHE